jgi:LCP family protein required for cell wall assembly
MKEFKAKRLTKGLPPSRRVEIKKEEPSQKNSAHAEAGKPTWKKMGLRFVQKHFIWASIIIVALVGITKASYNIATLAENISVKEVVLSIFSEKIVTDEDNHTNILLLGQGGANHAGGTLTDTIIVVSLDHDNHLTSMLSIPRDLYIETEELYGGNRINSLVELYAEKLVYENGLSEETAYNQGYELLRDTVSEILDIPIHYYAVIDFYGFVDIVDAIGGVDVNVENDIYDPLYPADDGSINYQTFVMEAGPQHLDGATALKYVRSRETTSDFDRAARQQQVLHALKEKALSLGVLTSPGKLKDIYDAVDQNFQTDLQWDEMVYLAKISEKFDTSNLRTWVINDNPLDVGGFLYTPERELYGGASVLLPYVSDYSDIQTFADLVLKHPEVHAEKLKFQVLNGTKTNGVATETLYYLLRFGFDVVRYGNAPNRETLISRTIPVTALLQGQTGENIPESAEVDYLMETFIPVGFQLTELPAEYSPTEWETDADVILELGQDYVDWMQENQKHFY